MLAVCTQEYRAIGLLGAATDSYDADGRVLRHAPHSHVTRAAIERVLPQFRGEIEQIPPMCVLLRLATPSVKSVSTRHTD